jgi:hypothetical protein
MTTPVPPDAPVAARTGTQIVAGGCFAVLLFATAVALAITRAVAVKGTILDDSSLLYVGMGVGFAISALLAVPHVLVVKRFRTERAVSNAFLSWLFLSIYFLVVAAIGVPIVNVALDPSPPRTRILTVQSFRTGTIKRGVVYVVTVPSWRAGERTLELRVSRAMTVGERVRVISHEGLLGWDWVESAEPVP